jgi:hypothetical protein
MRKLDFLIAGVQKGGTTALHGFLSRHPGLFLPAAKELHFFDNEQVNWEAPDYSTLHSHFIGRHEHQLAGEVTPIYIYWRESMGRIHAYNPDIKIVLLLRDPVERAYSHWLMEVTRKKEIMSFGQAIREGRERNSSQHRVFSYVERGFYSKQIQRVLSHFPREQVLFLKTEDLREKHARTLNSVCAFLGVGAFDTMPLGAYVNVRRSHAAPMDEVDRAYLADLFRDDIKTTEQMTGLSLACQ